jgi:hypothetical protein
MVSVYSCFFAGIFFPTYSIVAAQRACTPWFMCEDLVSRPSSST